VRVAEELCAGFLGPARSATRSEIAAADPRKRTSAKNVDGCRNASANAPPYLHGHVRLASLRRADPAGMSIESHGPRT